MRLDLALVARGLARSRSHARQMLEDDRVRVAGLSKPKPSARVGDDAVIEARPDPYVSRGARKLIAALDQSGLRVSGRVLDAGASSGGFTQVLLERGAKLVHAIDVGHDQMAASLRHDRRVVVTEGLNLRDLSLDHVGGRRLDLVVADVSFISLRLILDALMAVTRPDGAVLVLVKPQFEVGRGNLNSRGVVTSPEAGAAAVAAVVDHAARLGWSQVWSGPSVLPGQNGNQEVFCLFRRSAPEVSSPDQTG